MESLLQDLRFAMRTLAKAPGFTAVAVITLALGIGAATAGFSLLNWVLLRPVPGVSDPRRLAYVTFASHERGGYSPNGVTPDERDRVVRASPAAAGLSGREGPITVSVAAGAGEPRRLGAEFVMTDYLTTLGTRIQAGRNLATDDDAPPGGRPVVVISDWLWHNLLDAKADAIGQSIRINGVSFTVVGVASPGYRGIDHFSQADLWLPGLVEWDVQHFTHRPVSRLEYPYRFVLRLRPGASFAQAEGQLGAAVRTLASSDTDHFSPTVSATVTPGLGLEGAFGGRDAIEHQLALVMGAAGLMLLVTCANVANLLLFRRMQRRADVVVRLVLGASRARLVRHFLAESAVIGVLSAGGGVVLAVWLEGVFRSLRLLRFISMNGIGIDWRVMLFAAAAGILASIVAGIAPAVLASDVNLGTDLRSAGPTQVGGAPLLRSSLSAVQVAVSLTLVAGGYLFARTIQSYARISPGFDPSGVTIFTVDPARQGYTSAQKQTYYRSLVQRIAARPGVEHVGLVGLPPFTGITNGDRIRRADASPDATPLDVAVDQVSGEFFAALEIPILRGTTFRGSDEWPDSTKSIGIVILSNVLAHRLYGDADPVGTVVELPRRSGPDRAVVVGVAGDIRWNSLAGDVEHLLYEPTGQWEEIYEPMIAVRSRAPSATVVRDVQREGSALDPSLSIESRGPLTDAVAASLSSQTLMFKLVGILSILTLALTAIGVYALVAYGVTTRTREFGLRMALGAEARDIVRVAVRPAITIVGVGIIAGVGGALYLTRFIAASLYGVSRFDPAAFIVAAVVLGVAVLLASWLPARRAAKVDPMVALRYE